MASLLSRLRAAEIAYASRQAVVDGERRLTFADVAERSGRAANALLSLTGAPANVAVLLPNCAEVVELDLALVKAGLARVSINPRLADDERRFVIDDSEARVVVYHAEFAGFVEAVHDERPELALVRVGGEGPGTAYDELVRAAAPVPPAPRPRGGDPSLIMYTSGTSGRPKGAVWTFATRTASVANMLLNELTPERAARMLHVGPMAHGSGSKIIPVFLRGGANVIASHFDAAQFFDTVAAERVTASFMVPTMVQMLVETPCRAGATASLRHVAYGGAKMPLPTITAALDRFGPVFAQVFGASEAPHPALLLAADDHVGVDAAVLSSAGRPVIDVDLAFESPDVPYAPGASGELLIRSPHVFAGYWRQPSATERAFVDGYYRTGDVAEVIDGGYVAIVGRRKEMIISGGFNVYPAEVERVLVDAPGVAAVCVFGVPDERWGERVVAAVVPADGETSIDALDAACARLLAGYKKPRDFVVLPSLPTGPTGKVLRDEVRRQYVERVR